MQNRIVTLSDLPKETGTKKADQKPSESTSLSVKPDDKRKGPQTRLPETSKLIQQFAAPKPKMVSSESPSAQTTAVTETKLNPENPTIDEKRKVRDKLKVAVGVVGLFGALFAIRQFQSAASNSNGGIQKPSCKPNASCLI